MLMKHAIALLFSASVNLAAVLQTLQVINEQLQPYSIVAKGTTIDVPWNTSTSLNMSSEELDRVRPACNARRFGSDLDIAACAEALDLIATQDREGTIGMRHDGNS